MQRSPSLVDFPPPELLLLGGIGMNTAKVPKDTLPPSSCLYVKFWLNYPFALEWCGGD